MARISLDDVVDEARKALPAALFDFIAAGAGSESSIAGNVEAWQQWVIAPTVLRGSGSPSTMTQVAGAALRTPFLLAPSGRQRALHPEGELAAARAAASAGTVYCLSTSATTDMHELPATGATVWQQLYVSTDRDWTWMMVDEAARLGFGQILITVDRPHEAYRPRAARHGRSIPLPSGVEVTSHRGDGSTRASEPGVWDPDLSWDDIREIVSRSEIPVGVKGILRSDDALRAIDAGAASIVVSNHGGRQIDGVVSSADALVDVAKAVDGEVPLLVDGGIRSGVDAFRALALGASAVLIGRPYLWALAVSGQQGVEDTLDTLTSELAEVMGLAGAATISDIRRDLLTRRL